MINEKWDAKPAQSYFNLLYVSTFIPFREISWLNLVSIWGTPIPSSFLVGFRSVVPQTITLVLVSIYFDCLFRCVTYISKWWDASTENHQNRIQSPTMLVWGYVFLDLWEHRHLVDPNQQPWDLSYSNLETFHSCLDRIHACFQTFQPMFSNFDRFFSGYFFWAMISWTSMVLVGWTLSFSYILRIHFLLDPCWGNIWCFLGILEILERRGTADFLHSSFEHGPVFGYSQCL
jgi:hypothetical protein